MRAQAQQATNIQSHSQKKKTNGMEQNRDQNDDSDYEFEVEAAAVLSDDDDVALAENIIEEQSQTSSRKYNKYGGRQK